MAPIGPGPASQALQQRKVAAVAAGVSTGLPVYVTEASGGILRDADGKCAGGMLPVYREGDLIIVSPKAALRDGDRVDSGPGSCT